MSFLERAFTIGAAIVAILLTRFLPFLIFRGEKKTPGYIRYLGSVLPASVFGLLVIYCLKDVSIFRGMHAVPEMLGILLTVLLHVWRKNMMLSIAGGTLFYMLLIAWI